MTTDKEVKENFVEIPKELTVAILKDGTAWIDPSQLAKWYVFIHNKYSDSVNEKVSKSMRSDMLHSQVLQ